MPFVFTHFDILPNIYYALLPSFPSDNIEYAESFFENMRANESEKFNSVNSRAAVNGSMVDYKTIPWDWLDLHECDQ